MKLAKIAVISAALWAVFLCAPAGAQWQTPNHSVPVGAGAGHTGFGSVGPCTLHQYIGGNGSSADPTCQTLPTLIGDSGSGGTAGMAPAPASGDAAAGKFLKADGTYQVPPGAGAGATTAANNIFTGEDQFQAGISYGPSAPAPDTDLFGYSSTRPVWNRIKRDQNLSIGHIIGVHDFWGKNSSGTSIKWAYLTAGVNDCLVRVSISGSPCLGGENAAAGEEGSFNFWVVNGGTSYVNVVKIDDNGLAINGTGNLYLPAGQGIVMPDSTSTQTYVLTYNSNLLDLTSCNNVGRTCSAAGGSGRGIRFFTSASGVGQPALFLAEDGTLTFGTSSLGGSGVAGSKALCLDSSNRLFKSTTTACP